MEYNLAHIPVQRRGGAMKRSMRTVLVLSAMVALSSSCDSGIISPRSLRDTVAAPVFSPPGGTYAEPQTVTLTSSTGGASIFYTMDGSAPTSSSTRYESPLTVSANATVNAIAVDGGMVTSSVGMATYTISSGGPGSTIPWNNSVGYVELKDSRDGQVYRAVKIGAQTWMAENLNYRNTSGSSDTVGVCYKNLDDSCSLFGRLYTWTEAMDGSSSSNGIPSGVRGICPEGWHVPSDAEWSTLVRQVDSTSSAIMLKSRSGWYYSVGGYDAYGFRGLPAGGRGTDGSFFSSGDFGYWWVATESDASKAWVRGLWSYAHCTSVLRDADLKARSFSLRCVQDP